MAKKLPYLCACFTKDISLRHLAGITSTIEINEGSGDGILKWLAREVQKQASFEVYYVRMVKVTLEENIENDFHIIIEGSDEKTRKVIIWEGVGHDGFYFNFEI